MKNQEPHRLIPTMMCIAPAALSCSLFGQSEYGVVIIEPWDTSYSLASSEVSGINNNNVVSGCASPISGGCSFLWTLDGGKEAVNLAGIINDNGVVVSHSTLRWPDGTLQALENAEGFSVNGLDINSDNVVAGAWGSTVCEAVSEAAVWDPESGITLFFHDLDIFAADQLRGVNEHTEVVGMLSLTGCGDYEAFYYNLHTGEFVDLHGLLGGSGITEVFDINDDGVVLGEGPHDGTNRPFLWSQDDGFTFLPALDGALPTNTHLTSLNSSAQAVGWATVSGSGSRGIIWDNTNGTRDLNELGANALPDDFTIDAAVAINDNGWIIGSGHYGSWSPSRAVVLIPAEPNPPIVGDFDGNGTVNVADLLALLGSWGTCGEGPCPTDLTGDGSVNVNDLLVLLSNWG